eukprot:scaffold24005_cov196-Cylindrotheca_fusiformis.AAC.4
MYGYTCRLGKEWARNVGRQADCRRNAFRSKVPVPNGTSAASRLDTTCVIFTSIVFEFKSMYGYASRLGKE